MTFTNPISGVTYAQHDDAALAAALTAAGWHPASCDIGQHVLVSFSNTWEGWGTVIKHYKNGAVRVRYDDGHGGNPRRYQIWVQG